MADTNINNEARKAIHKIVVLTAEDVWAKSLLLLTAFPFVLLPIAGGDIGF